MQRYSTVIAAALAGACIGGLAAQGMHAQAKGPSAYYIVEIDVTNEDVFNKQWIPKADETIKAAGGTYLVRSANIERIEGAAPKRLLITKWPRQADLMARIRRLYAHPADARQSGQIRALIRGRRRELARLSPTAASRRKQCYSKPPTSKAARRYAKTLRECRSNRRNPGLFSADDTRNIAWRRRSPAAS